MKRYLWILCLLPILFSCSQEGGENAYAPPAIPVVATEVEQRDVPLYMDAIGSIRPKQSVEIRPQVSGMLLAVHFKDGDSVKKGQLLFSIESSTYESKLEEAKAQLAQDKANLDSALKKYERYEKLANKDLVSGQEWDEVQAVVIKNRATLEADEARVKAAAREVGLCKIEAPIDGTIGRSTVDPGNLITAWQTTSLATLSDIDTLFVDFALTEKEFAQLGSGKEMQIEICPLCGLQKKGRGEISYIDHQFDVSTGMVAIRAKVDNRERTFLPGQGVKVLIPVNIITAAKLLPQKSVKINQNGPYVYVVQADNTVIIRQVDLGDEEGEDVIIAGGVEPGEKIVVEGHLRLSPGIKVEIKGSGATQ